ncbi:MAG: hypothetical protein HOV81_06560 [Kofleriaceae bacterium]|nr:hypothetical protein [Kofleriaceae bacterium]
MRWTVLLVTLVLGGCDKLFGLEPVSARDGGGVDVPRLAEDGRATDDAGACIPGVFDEDGDGIADNCDGCPTVPSNDDDEDVDGLPDACDPNVAFGARDRILFAAMFGDPAELTRGFVSANAVHDPTNNGRISLGTQGVLRTISTYEPTKIEIRLAGIGGVNVTSTTSLAVGGVACKVAAAGCAGALSATCITAAPGGAAGEYPGAPATIRLLELIQGENLPDCQVGNGTEFASAEPTMTVMTGSLDLLTSSTGTALVESIVIYGAAQP